MMVVTMVVETPLPCLAMMMVESPIPSQVPHPTCFSSKAGTLSTPPLPCWAPLLGDDDGGDDDGGVALPLLGSACC